MSANFSDAGRNLQNGDVSPPQNIRRHPRPQAGGAGRAMLTPQAKRRICGRPRRILSMPYGRLRANFNPLTRELRSVTMRRITQEPTVIPIDLHATVRYLPEVGSRIAGGCFLRGGSVCIFAGSSRSGSVAEADAQLRLLVMALTTITFAGIKSCRSHFPTRGGTVSRLSLPLWVVSPAAAFQKENHNGT